MFEELDDPEFPQITYRRGASGIPNPVIRGTGIRVQSIVVAYKQWAMPVATIAKQYDLPVRQIEEALAFYKAHRAEIETQMASEERLAETLHPHI